MHWKTIRREETEAETEKKFVGIEHKIKDIMSTKNKPDVIRKVDKLNMSL